MQCARHAACGVLRAARPALPWYSASLPTGTASLSGYGAGGASWILPVIGAALVAEALSLHRVDDRGLDASDRRLLTLMLEGYGGGPVGLDTLAAGLGEDSATLEAVVEPYLLQLGFLQRTPRGRMVTPAGRNHLGWPTGAVA